MFLQSNNFQARAFFLKKKKTGALLFLKKGNMFEINCRTWNSGKADLE